MHNRKLTTAEKDGTRQRTPKLIGQLLPWGFCGLTLGVLATFSLQGEEWPQWRGSQRDGISRETGLLRQWAREGPPLLWKTQGVGIGHSSVAIAQGRLFTMGAFEDTESVVALNATTGEPLWATPLGMRFQDDQGDGPRSTPTVVGNRIYALGANGDLSCLDVSTGRALWTRNVLSEFEAPNIAHGLCESPLVVGNLVLVNPGAEGASVVALNRQDGSLVWKSLSDPASYSSAVQARLAGIPQVIFFTGLRAAGLDLYTGRLLWDYDRAANDIKIHVATPIVSGNRVFVSSDYGQGGGLVQLSAQEGKVAAREVYFNREMKNHHASPILVNGYLYGYSSAILTAMRFKDGEVGWKHRSVGKGSLLYADGHLYCLSEKGVVGLVEVSPQEYREKSRFQISTANFTWSPLALAGGRLYLRDQDQIYCYDVKRRSAASSRP